MNDKYEKATDGVLRSIVVIPNEQLTDVPYFSREYNEYFHYVLIQLFCRENGLNYKDRSELIENGYIVILTVNPNSANEIFLCYVPETISEKQYEYLVNFKETILGYKMFGFSVFVNRNEAIEDDGSPSELIDYFYELLEDCLPKRSK